MITKIGSEQYGVATYLVDSTDEIANLPTKDGVGSAAIVPGTGAVYMLNGSREWVEFGGDENV